jgi:acyl carrier protein
MNHMNATDRTQDRIRSGLEQFVREIGRIPPSDTEFSQHSELFDSGYIDSLGVVALSTYIEQRFGVALAEEQLFDPRFTTIAGIAEIIASGVGSSPGTDR